MASHIEDFLGMETQEGPPASAPPSPSPAPAQSRAAEPSLDDVDVKASLLLICILLAIVPDVLVDTAFLAAALSLLLLLNLSLALLDKYGCTETDSARFHVEEWRRAVWKLNRAVAEVLMGVSRVFVIVLAMAVRKGGLLLMFCLVVMLRRIPFMIICGLSIVGVLTLAAKVSLD